MGEGEEQDFSDWADLAVERLFIDGARAEDRGVSSPTRPRYAVVLDEGFQLPSVLAEGATFAEAIANAWSDFQDSPYARKEVKGTPLLTDAIGKAFPRVPTDPSPQTETHIEEFVKATRQRDLLSEFILWYGERHDKDPDAYPKALNHGEWMQTFGDFIGQLE